MLVIDGFEMAVEWALNIVIPIFKGKVDIWNCNCNRGKKRNKGILEVLFRSVMGLYEGAKTRVRVDSELSEELEVDVLEGKWRSQSFQDILLAGNVK